MDFEIFKQKGLVIFKANGLYVNLKIFMHVCDVDYTWIYIFMFRYG